MDTLDIDLYRTILYSGIMSNKKYNPADYKDADFITIGSGPIRIQVDRRHMKNMADYWFIAKALFKIESDAGLIKTLAEESADRGEEPQKI